MLTTLQIIFSIYTINYLYVDFKEFLLVLLAVSSMVFTIMGIWIAFLYPNALQRLMTSEKVENADFGESLSNTKRLEGLVSSVMKSALIVTVIMLIFLLKIVLSSTPFYLDYLQYIKAMALSLVVLLTVLQLESIFSIIRSNVMFINDLHYKRENKEADADI